MGIEGVPVLGNRPAEGDLVVHAKLGEGAVVKTKDRSFEVRFTGGRMCTFNGDCYGRVVLPVAQSASKSSGTQEKTLAPKPKTPPKAKGRRDGTARPDRAAVVARAKAAPGQGVRGLEPTDFKKKGDELTQVLRCPQMERYRTARGASIALGLDEADLLKAARQGTPLEGSYWYFLDLPPDKPGPGSSLGSLIKTPVR